MAAARLYLIVLLMTVWPMQNFAQAKNNITAPRLQRCDRLDESKRMDCLQKVRAEALQRFLARGR